MVFSNGRSKMDISGIVGTAKEAEDLINLPAKNKMGSETMH